MTDPVLKDTRVLYYESEFPKQDQEIPVLQKKMKPVPDCGEESYVGHERLLNCRVLITEGDLDSLATRQRQLEEKLPVFGQNSLMERAGQPVELAPVYVFLASNEASYVTAQIYGVTGGEAINL